MLLNLTVVYGLRAMAVLACLPSGDSLNAAGLSERTGVPQQYLSKVMRKLVVARLVRAQRGYGGGFALHRPPREVRIVDVLQALDLALHSGCAFSFAACDVSNPCALHPIWSRLQDDLDRWSRNVTLADVDVARMHAPARTPQREPRRSGPNKKR